MLTVSTRASAQPPLPSEVQKTRSHDQLPLEMLDVAIAPGARSAYFASLRAFAERFGFAIRIAPTTPSGRDFLTHMYREDIKVLGANSLRVEGFALGFYTTCRADPDATTRQNVTLMIEDLKARLSKLKGVVVQAGR
jgi:hypothetical protein